MSGKDWLCPVCGHLDSEALAVCENTPEHD